MSKDNVARIIPVKPPIENKKIKLKKYKNGVLKSIEPLYIVAIQLNTLIPEGIATKNVSKENSMDAN